MTTTVGRFTIWTTLAVLAIVVIAVILLSRFL